MSREPYAVLNIDYIDHAHGTKREKDCAKDRADERTYTAVALPERKT